MEEFLASLGIDPNGVDYTVSLVSPRDIKRLNRQYRGKNRATDVLSFPMLNITAGQKPTRENFPMEYNPQTKKVYLGDIVINWKERDHKDLIEHSLLHLLGHHHEGDE